MKEGETSRMPLTFCLVHSMAVPFTKDTGGRSDLGAESTIPQVRFEMPLRHLNVDFR